MQSNRVRLRKEDAIGALFRLFTDDGVLLESGEELFADMVVSNADVEHTDRALLPKEYQQKSDKYWESRVLAPSAYILYLGIKGKLPQMEQLVEPEPHSAPIPA